MTRKSVPVASRGAAPAARAKAGAPVKAPAKAAAKVAAKVADAPAAPAPARAAKTAVKAPKASAKPAPKPAAKPAARPAAKAVARPAAKPAAKQKTTSATTAAAKSTVKEKATRSVARQPAVALKSAAMALVRAAKGGAASRARTVQPAPAPAEAARPSLVRDSFTMPETEYAVLASVKQACLKAGVEVKKSELLRIGVALVGRLDMATLRQVLDSLPQLKTGRPPSQ